MQKAVGSKQKAVGSRQSRETLLTHVRLLRSQISDLRFQKKTRLLPIACLLLTARFQKKTRLLPTAFCLLLTALCLLPSPAPAQTPVDKMVATVNGGVGPQLITYSDLLWQLALQPSSSLASPSSTDLNQALKLLEDQHLILQEAEKLPTSAPTEVEVQKARDELARHFPPGELEARMAKVGLTSKRLDQIISDRLAMVKYLDFRFRSFVLITQKDIADYYNEVYVPQERSRGRIVRTLAEANADIGRLLTESKIESETDTFIDSLRDRAEIVILNPV